ncbi:hypothetical protein OEB99_04200 [Actinotalea sp. M2MS4P-6]|uniref:hypothetical protein n=1 Tax=Actinotalea sp. M2MS4P-6 TaxID=2983762 RepID=UPI0021E3CC30|nr:hypothetical protein [Actinotalea sp. M2MS4P-6]MCV2393501.1 hypothetical protein [Actinotalea sp. M2MS4P-6]
MLSLTTTATATLLAVALGSAPTTLTTLATDGSDPSGSGTDSGTVTIEVDAARVQHLCDETLPHVLQRAQATLDRIQGDADTVGSAAWVRDRAAQAADEGHDDLARRLEFRADQRLGHVDEIEALIDRLEGFDATICSQVEG